MLQNKQEMFSEKQAFLTVAAHDSTNVLYIGPHGDDVNRFMTLFIQVRTAVTGESGATVAFSVSTGSVPETVTTVLWNTAALPVAGLTKGKFVAKIPLPVGVKQYLKVTYTVGTAALLTGAFDAGIIWEIDR